MKSLLINNELIEGIFGYRSFEKTGANTISRYNKYIVKRNFSFLEADSLFKRKNFIK